MAKQKAVEESTGDDSAGKVNFIKSKTPIHSHGMTAAEIAEVRVREANGDVETIAPNKLEKIQDKYFKEDFAGYQVKMHERNFYHVAIEDRTFDQQSGKRLSFAHITTFDQVTWNSVKEADVIKSKTLEIIHDPELEPKNAPLVTIEYTK